MTSRRLLDRAIEHVPNWVLNRADRIAKSAIAEHLLNENHSCDRMNDFKIIYKARHVSFLKFAEAVAIRRLRPVLNVQQEMDFRLKLPWS